MHQALDSDQPPGGGRDLWLMSPGTGCLGVRGHFLMVLRWLGVFGMACVLAVQLVGPAARRYVALVVSSHVLLACTDVQHPLCTHCSYNLRGDLFLQENLALRSPLIGAGQERCEAGSPGTHIYLPAREKACLACCFQPV